MKCAMQKLRIADSAIRYLLRIQLTLGLLVCYAVSVWGQNAGELVAGSKGMVVTASAEASRVGLEILQKGGNAVDAAVAVGFALAATYPSAGNLGGGSYILIRMADGREAVIDARETAPRAAHRNMYLDSNKNVIPGSSLYGPLSAGVPGTVDGLLLALERYGTLRRGDVLAPAIVLAETGFPLHKRAAGLFSIYKNDLMRYSSSSKIFFKGNGGAYNEGDLWRQPELAGTLRRISDKGRDGFYDGKTADCIIQTMQAQGGIITRGDLHGYKAIVRQPLRGTYRGYTIISAPPSSSGGIALIQMLNMMEPYRMKRYGFHSAQAVHLMAEAMKRAFADRAAYLGDPAFVSIPVGLLTSKQYAQSRMRNFQPMKATPADEILPGMAAREEGTNTTHYSIIDGQGNAVSVTTTINSVFGSKCVVDGAGFLLNNEMDDFSIKAGAPNQFGLIGNTANAIEPGKRMLSSMTPVIVLKNEKPFLITGSPGGSTIITTVLHITSNCIDYALKADKAVKQGRFHHQWRPDTLLYEPSAFSPSVIPTLKKFGYHMKTIESIGRVEAIIVDWKRRRYEGCSDPRGYGAALGY